MKQFLLACFVIFGLVACTTPTPESLPVETTSAPVIPSATAPPVTATLLPPTDTAVPSPAPTYTPAPTNTKPSLEPSPLPVENTDACGAFTSYLAPEMTAVVNPFPPVPNRLRAEPAMASEYLGQIFPAERVQILAGPQCADGFLWWQVFASEQNLTGWTIEGEADEAWLIPDSDAGFSLQYQPVPEDWEAYVNAEWGFTFRHPPMSDCCSVGGAMLYDPVELITLAEEGTTSTGSGKPFNGFGVAGMTLPASMTFETYIENEKQELLRWCDTCTGKESTLVMGGNTGVWLQDYSMWGIQMIYVPSSDGARVIVFSWGEGTDESFNALLTQIFSTFRFIHP